MYIRMASVPRTKTLPMSEYLKLVNKSKSGWRCFFIMQDEVSNLNYYIHNFMERNRNMRNNIDNPDYDLDITFLKNQFIEMYDKLKQYSECPVCYETLTKSNMEVPKCGHLICKSCVEKIKQSSTPVCPNCRKIY